MAIFLFCPQQTSCVMSMWSPLSQRAKVNQLINNMKRTSVNLCHTDSKVADCRNLQ